MAISLVMAGKNKFSCRSKISAAKVRQIVKLFAIDLTATQIAQVTGLNRNTVNRYLTAFRERIARFCEAETPIRGVVEVDESYFGARRVRGVRGRGARGKTIVFGVFKRNERVYTEIVPDCSKATLRGSIRGMLTLKVSFIQMVGVGTMVWWIWDTKSIFGLSMGATNLPMNTHTSTV